MCFHRVDETIKRVGKETGANSATHNSTDASVQERGPPPPHTRPLSHERIGGAMVRSIELGRKVDDRSIGNTLHMSHDDMHV